MINFLGELCSSCSQVLLMLSITLGEWTMWPGCPHGCPYFCAMGIRVVMSAVSMCKHVIIFANKFSVVSQWICSLVKRHGFRG